MTDDYAEAYDMKGLDSWPQKLINRIRGLRARFTATAGRMGSDGVLYPAVDRVLWKREVFNVADTVGTAHTLIPVLPGWLGVVAEDMTQIELRIRAQREIQGHSVNTDNLTVTIRDIAAAAWIAVQISSYYTAIAATPVVPKEIHLALQPNYVSLDVVFNDWAAAETHRANFIIEAYRIIPARR